VWPYASLVTTKKEVMLLAIDITEEGVLPAINITNEVIFKRKHVMQEEKCKE